MEVQQPTTTKGKLKSQRLVRKEGGFYSSTAQSGRMGDDCLKIHLLQKSWAKSSHPQPDQNKMPFSEFLFPFKIPSFGTYRWLRSSYPGTLACSQLLWGSVSHQEPVAGTGWGAVLPLTMCILGLPGPEDMPVSAFTRWGGVGRGERERKRDSFLEVKGHVTLDMEKTGQHAIQVQVLISKPGARDNFLFPSVYISFNMEWVKYLLRMTN